MGVIKKMGGMEMRIVGFVKIKRSKIKYKRNGQVYHTACWDSLQSTKIIEYRLV